MIRVVLKPRLNYPYRNNFRLAYIKHGDKGDELIILHFDKTFYITKRNDNTIIIMVNSPLSLNKVKSKLIRLLAKYEIS